MPRNGLRAERPRSHVAELFGSRPLGLTSAKAPRNTFHGRILKRRLQHLKAHRSPQFIFKTKVAWVRQALRDCSRYAQISGLEIAARKKKPTAIWLYYNDEITTKAIG